jgi:hydroxyacylglutathione hydrolase
VGLEVDVLSTPGHSPGHVTYAPRGANAIFSGDVLFQSSIGRTDLPGGDYPTLMASIARLLDRFADDTLVHPGHMGLTTLGAERRTNPFLADLVH